MSSVASAIVIPQDVQNITELRLAIQSANQTGTPSRINLLPGNYTFETTTTADSARGAVNPLDGDLDIIRNLEIIGNGQVIDAGNRDRIFYIQGTTTTLPYVTLRNLTLRNGCVLAPNAPGGGVFGVLTNLTLENCLVTSNSTLEDGGGVAVFGYYDDLLQSVTRSSLTLNSTTFTLNRGANGGGVATCLSHLTVTSGSMSNNLAAALLGTLGGGGLLATGGACNVSITNNHAVSSNASGGYAGGMSFLAVNPPEITNARINGNLAGVAGGGVSCMEASPTLTNCLLTSNSAGVSGGGLNCLTRSSLVLMNCTLSGNNLVIGPLTHQGGGIYLNDDSHPNIVNTVIEGSNRWAIYAESGSSPNWLAYSLFDNNVGNLRDTVSSSTYIQGNVYGNAGFVSKATGNYHLRSISAAVDQGIRQTSTGLQTFTAPLNDKDGNSRPLDIAGLGRDGGGEGFDIGAYEMQRSRIQQSPISISATL